MNTRGMGMAWFGEGVTTRNVPGGLLIPSLIGSVHSMHIKDISIIQPVLGSRTMLRPAGARTAMNAIIIPTGPAFKVLLLFVLAFFICYFTSMTVLGSVISQLHMRQLRQRNQCLQSGGLDTPEEDHSGPEMDCNLGSVSPK